MSNDFNRFSDVKNSREQPAEEFFIITPHASTSLSAATRGIMVNTDTTISFRTVSGNSLASVPIAGKIIYPLVLSHVFSANGSSVWGLR